MRKIRRLLLGLLGGGLLCLLAALVFLHCTLPDTFYVQDIQSDFSIASLPFLRAEDGTSSLAAASGGQSDTSKNTTLTLLNIPVKTVRTVQRQAQSVAVCGTPFGVKMFSNGALVVAFSDQFTLHGAENPAKQAGLRLGDLIVSANGRQIRTNEELTEAIAASAGAEMSLLYLRDGSEYNCTLIPVKDLKSGVYRAGIWVRDSSAGIGTLTFYNPENQTFAGLGHAISDTDTGETVSLLSGEIVPVTITGAVAGTAGSPGELRGEFTAGDSLGQVLSNNETGVYAKAAQPLQAETVYPIAEIQEIEIGPAEIFTTISGTTPKAYQVEIERVSLNGTDPNKNLLLRVTDPELLAQTGGIVQGMSGSPIVQNGKLVGAITHVLVNSPAKGYGIFAQTMLEQTELLENP